MLTYNVKLNNDNYKRKKLVWSEKYVAPDLSFVSGVTDQKYHIDKNEYIAASIGNGTNFSSLKVSCNNVCRNGYIKVVGKEYKIYESRKATIRSSSFKYIEVNGVYYYINGGNPTIKNFLKEKWTKVNNKYEVSIVEGDVQGSVDMDKGVVKIDTIYWIEDETVTIDGDTYIFDRYVNGLKYYEKGKFLEPNEITACDDIQYNHFDKESKYLYVTKFELTKRGDELIDTDFVTLCQYTFYVYYKGDYCPVYRSGVTFESDEEETIKYYCKVPGNPCGEGQDCEVKTDTETQTETGDKKILPSRFNKIIGYDPYIEIDNVKYPVEYYIQNSNSGDMLSLYLSEGTYSLRLGDSITLSYYDNNGTKYPVYEIEGNKFVMYNNLRYNVESNIADTVSINNVDYDVSYPNGKKKDVDAFVNIDGDNVPMKIENFEANVFYLKRYGLIVLPGESQATDARYKITSRDGVKIDGDVYRILYGVDEYHDGYIITDKPFLTDFKILSIEGSSWLVCEPDLYTAEYDDNFINTISPKLCDVYAQHENIAVYSKNKAFGTKPVRPQATFSEDAVMESSNDYYNLFNNLVLFTNTYYIQLDIPLTMNVVNNIMQEDIVERDFYNAKKEKLINPIIDMEKDVYSPKIITSNGGKYTGSETEFGDINEIVINLHFRTRDMNNWKVNDGNADASVKDTLDNWFITDYFPYKELINDRNSSVLMNSSDLIGLLGFKNDDVFYQKSKIEKSFLRFSYYDSPDPNTQSLLCTSTVFMDEHMLYKKYVDNARRNIHDYGIIQIPPTGETETGYAMNRASVMTECLKGKHTNGRLSYTYDEVDLTAMTEDNNRVDSRFIIKNKYATDTSSEGFYLYIYREYSENLHPKPIYMKVEFNHAGIGRTIPFIIPMRWKEGTDNVHLPDRKLELYGEDLDYLKQGYPLSYVYAQSYIPLYAVYDFKDKQYAYVFDSRYIQPNGDKLIFDMFEIKIADENTATNSERAQVRNNDINRANIDVNKNQFDDII